MTIKRKIHNILYPKLGKIMMLHSINSPEFIQSLVHRVQGEGYEIVSIDGAVERMKTKCRKKFACFTFDDGFLNTFTIVFPVMAKENVPFCVYMTRDFYRGKSQPVWDTSAMMMNAEQLKEMSANPLCTVGVHTCSHPHLSELHAEDQRKELLDCKIDLEVLLGKRIKHMAYPHGSYNDDTLMIVSELGFETAVTTSGRYVRGDTKLLELDRIFV